MKDRITNLINNFNDSILALFFVGILVLSLVVAQSISVSRISANNVLGTSNSRQEFILNNIGSPLYSLNFIQKPYQLSFDITLNPKGTKNFNIILGKVNSMVQGGLVYRSTLTIPDVYRDDFNINIIISGKSYPLLDINNTYINEIKIPYGNDLELSLEFNTDKEIYYKENLQLNLYK